MYAQFDDPARVADYGYFANERLEPVVLTGSDLADAIESGVAPDGAPFSDWVPKLIEGWRFQPVDNDDTIRMFRALLDSKDPHTVNDTMNILKDVAFENYGEEA